MSSIDENYGVLGMNGINSLRNESDLSRRRVLRRSVWGRRSVSRQQGVTTLGFIILASFIAVIAFGALRLTPIYLNYMKIVGVVDGVQKEFDGKNSTRAMIRSSISRRFDVESVSVIVARDVAVTTVDGGMQVAAVYDHTSPFIANISFTVHFNKTELIRR
jgi:hypothetical protein